MKKKFLVILMALLALSVVPVFAGELTISGAGSESIKFSALGQIITLCTGIIPGALIAIKFMLDVVSAYYHREQDPSKLQKAIVNFIIVVLIIVAYIVFVNFIFKGDATTTGENASNRSNFFQGLISTGAELSGPVDMSTMEFDLSGFSVEDVEALL